MKTLFCLLIAATLSFASHAQQGIRHDAVKSLPDIVVYDLNGKPFQLRELAKNKVLFIDNWFIPCPQCFAEMRMLHQLYAKYAGNDKVCFITISATDPAIVRKFIAKDSSLAKYVNSYQYFSGLSYFKLPVYFFAGCDAKVLIPGKIQHWIPPADRSHCPDNIFHFSGYPTILIFDKNGSAIFEQSGYDGNEQANMARIENIIGPASAAK
jgi:thiol-disulfide isomerase/thioredoxin